MKDVTEARSPGAVRSVVIVDDHPLYSDALARKSDFLVRPTTGVISISLIVREAIDIGHVRGRDTAGRHDEVLRGDALAHIRLDRPAPRNLIEMGRGYRGVKVDILAQIEPVGHVIEVGQDIGLGGEFFGPVPFLL